MKYFLILFFISSFAEAQKAFTPVDLSYSRNRSHIEIQNMPRVASQDGVGICYAYMAATLMQFENCKTTNQNCSTLPEEELFSPLDLTRYALNRGEKPEQNRSAYKGLKGVVNGGNSHTVAIVAGLFVGKSASEKCVSLDRVLSKMNSRGESEEAKLAMWQRLQSHFNKYKNNQNCPSCLTEIYASAKKDIDRNLNIRASNEQLVKAFAQESYDKFLDELLGANKCKDDDEMVYFENDKVTFEMWPLDFAPTQTALKEKIKDVLKKDQRPIALTGVCLENKNPSQCSKAMRHGVVIAGYKQICKPSGQCRESFKVVNSWGKSWQDAYNGGWVDADALISQVENAPQAIGWFREKQN